MLLTMLEKGDIFIVDLQELCHLGTGELNANPWPLGWG